MQKVFILLLGFVFCWQEPTASQAQPPKILEITYALAYSPNGKILATAGVSGTVWLHFGSSQQLVRLSQKPIRTLSWISNTTFLAAGDDKIARVWDITRQKTRLELRGHQDWIRTSAASTKYLVTGSDDGTARVWNVNTGKLLRIFKGSHKISSLSLHGQLLATTGTSVKLWHIGTGKQIRTLEFAASSLAFSPDGKTLATGGIDGTAKLWAVDTGKAARVFRAHTDLIRALSFSPDGQQLVTGSDDASLSIWQLKRGTLGQRLRGHLDWVRSVAFSPDGQTLVSSADDQKIRFWELGINKAAKKL